MGVTFPRTRLGTSLLECLRSWITVPAAGNVSIGAVSMRVLSTQYILEVCLIDFV